MPDSSSSRNKLKPKGAMTSTSNPDRLPVFALIFQGSFEKSFNL